MQRSSAYAPESNAQQQKWSYCIIVQGPDIGQEKVDNLRTAAHELRNMAILPPRNDRVAKKAAK